MWLVFSHCLWEAVTQEWSPTIVGACVCSCRYNEPGGCRMAHHGCFLLLPPVFPVGSSGVYQQKLLSKKCLSTKTFLHYWFSCKSYLHFWLLQRHEVLHVWEEPGDACHFRSFLTVMISLVFIFNPPTLPWKKIFIPAFLVFPVLHFWNGKIAHLYLELNTSISSASLLCSSNGVKVHWIHSDQKPLSVSEHF